MKQQYQTIVHEVDIDTFYNFEKEEREKFDLLINNYLKEGWQILNVNIVGVTTTTQQSLLYRFYGFLSKKSGGRITYPQQNS